MIRRILALGGISIAITFAQNAAGARPCSRRRRERPRRGSSSPTTLRSTPTTSRRRRPGANPTCRASWPINHLIAVPLERPRQYGDRLYKTDQEFSGATACAAERAAAIPVADTPDRPMRQSSLIVDPPDGRFPELTDYGKKLQAEMKSSYRPGQTVFDSVDDFAAWDRCITRGMPVSMEPRNYNNGIRIMQSPGYVVILLEMAHEARVIPTTGMPPLDSNIKEWMGESRGHWEGNTLVVETTNFNGLVGAYQRGSPRLSRPASTGDSEHEDHRTVHACRPGHHRVQDENRGPDRAGDRLLHRGVSDVPRQQVPDVRVLLPRGQHSRCETTSRRRVTSALTPKRRSSLAPERDCAEKIVRFFRG